MLEQTGLSKLYERSDANVRQLEGLGRHRLAAGWACCPRQQPEPPWS